MRAAGRPSILLTQPALRIAGLINGLSQAGYEVMHAPMSAIEASDALDWSALRDALAACRWALVPSPGAIDVLMQHWVDFGWTWPASCGLGLIGPGSRAALQVWRSQVAGLVHTPIIEPHGPVYDAQALLACPAFQRLEGVPVAVLRRPDGSQAWLDTLRARGAALQVHEIYRVHACPLGPEARAWLEGRALHGLPFAVSVASVEAGRGLLHALAEHLCAGWTLAQPVLTQHPRIAATLSEQGWTRVLQHPPGLAGLLRALESLRL